MIWTLAYKNLWRNRRRTLLAELSIVFGVVVIVGAGNFIKGMQRDWAMFEIRSNTGALQVEHRDYEDLGKLEPLKVTIDRAAQRIERIRALPQVRAAFGKLKFTGLVSGGRTSTFFDGIAVDASRQRETLDLQEDLVVAGRALGETPGEVVLGADLASMLGLAIGDPVSIAVRSFQGGLNLTHGTLVGTKNGRHFPSTVYLEMHLPDAQRLLRIGDRVSQVVVGGHSFDAIPALMQGVESALRAEDTPLIARGYPDLIPVYPRAIASFKTVSILVGLVLFALVGSGVGNVMAMAVLERRREIGTLRALGMEKHHVQRLFLAEGLVAGALGAAVGLVLAGALSHFIAAHGGIPLPPPPGTNERIAIVPHLDPLMAALGGGIPLVVSLLAAWWPASRSADLNPVEALRES